MTLPLSVVVVAHDIPRELPRTLQSLATGYQRGISADDYEVIVVDNGSAAPIDRSVLRDLRGSFRIVRVDDASPSPGPAVNVGLEAAQGQMVGVLIDGARLVTPGLLHHALVGGRMHVHAGVITLGWYLGYDFQRQAMEAGWTRADEDRALRSIDWPADGYRLFEIATMDESSVDGWFEAIFESNCLFLPAATWDQLGGYDERFDAPGGGLVNHDVLRRASELDDVGWVVLLAEATFHQLHGGVATNVPGDQIERSMAVWKEQYETLRGRPVEPVRLGSPTFLGPLPEPVLARYGHALNARLHATGRLRVPVPPPVTMPVPAVGTDPLVAEWVELAAAAARRGHYAEAQAFARWARSAPRGAREVEPLLAVLATHRPVEELQPARRAQLSVDAAQACERAGDLAAAESHYREALTADPGNLAAHLGLSGLAMPGPDYYELLAHLHDELEPATYLEIGVFDGQSLARARPPTIAVGVDPEPQIDQPVSVELHLYRETSEEFFTNRDVRSLLGGRGPSLAFIDGLHEFPAVLRDFARVEAVSDPDTVVVLHDMMPFDEPTQRPGREFGFYTGDVWKLLHCLADVRPDLSWFTVRTPPSGLTVVTGLDPGSTLLRDQHDKLVARYSELAFEASRDVPGPVLDNDWRLVARVLRERRADLTPSRGDAGSDVTPRLEAPGTAAMARRIRDLESVDAERRKRIAALERELRRGGRAGAPNWEVDHAYAELEALRRTKLFRWTAAMRRLYGRVRFGRKRS